MKRSAYDVWSDLQETARDPSTWMLAPRRKCTVEKRSSAVEKKSKHETKDSICLELGKKYLKTFSQEEVAISNDKSSNINHVVNGSEPVQCKRKLEFQNGDKDTVPTVEPEEATESNNDANLPEVDLSVKDDVAEESNLNGRSLDGEAMVVDLEQTPSSTSIDNTINLSDSAKITFRVKDLVFGKLKGYDWWPGLIITYKEARQRPCLENCYWVRWFGDHKVSEVLNTNLDSFFEFKAKFTANRMRGIYKKGISEALELAAKRSSKIGLPIGGTKEAEDKRLEVLLQWALDSFNPLGKEGLSPKVLDEEDASSSDEEEETNKTPKLDRVKDHPVKFYRTDNKNRFGKPITNPILAENVKGLFDEVVEGKRKIDGLCLGCGDTKVVIQHPLFLGGLCEECKEAFVEGAYLFDEDGSQMYCSICSDGKEVLMCDSPGCCRSYCGVCIDMLCGVGTAVKIASEEKWICFMCSGESIRLLRKRVDWQERLRDFFMSDDEDEYPPLDFVPAVPLQDRKPIRVLALFDGIATGLVVLKQLDIELELYCASEIDNYAKLVTQVKHNGNVKQLGDIQFLTEKMVQELGPFDLVMGGSPCNDLSIANPARKGIYGEAPTPATSLRRQQQSVSGTAERVWSLSNESIERKNSIARDLGKLPSPSDGKKEGFRDALHRKMSRSSTIVRTAPSERDYWGEERPRTREEYNNTVRRMSVTVFGSYRRGSMIGLNPLERFRRAVRQIKFLNAIKFAAEQQRKAYHSGTSSFAMLQQELDDSTQLTNTEGLLFDPKFYKAQRDVHLTNEAIYILSINPSSRTDEELNTVITSVKASVPAFGEYPSRMQRQLLSVGWYERFEPNRVIIRQGHRALNFYFILSGSAIVSLMTKDRSTGISKDSTVAILGKGHSFGELALLHDTARTATVVCQSDVSLLAVSRQDFIDIFLRSSEEGEEQEHVRFLRSIPFLKRLPLEECNGKLGICLCHYFRRGVVIDKDPTNSEWIYIVKSGSCRVLTKVAKPRTDLIYHNSRKLPKLKEEELSRNSRLKRKKQNKRNSTEKVIDNNSLLLPSINPLERIRPKTHSGYSSNSKLYSAFLTDERRKTFDDMILKKSKHDLYANRIDMTNSRQGTYIYASKSESDFKKGEEKHRENLMKLVEAHRQEQEDKLMGINVKSNDNEDVFVQTELLKPKDQFGIASLIYHDIPQTKSFLISNGAECVLLSKAWVKKKSTESLLRSLRTAISPFPSTATLQQNLQDRANWENYKSEVIKGIISSRI